jgi:hypothetical protein
MQIYFVFVKQSNQRTYFGLATFFPESAVVLSCFPCWSCLFVDFPEFLLGVLVVFRDLPGDDICFGERWFPALVFGLHAFVVVGRGSLFCDPFEQRFYYLCNFEPRLEL